MGQLFGVVGLGVMGANLALNVERNGFPVAVYDRDPDVTGAFIAGRARGKNVKPARSHRELAALLAAPRRILVMVPAGSPVEAVLGELAPLLEKGDILVDGGNSHPRDTDRRIAALAPTGIRFVGMGVSGGAEGALHGPSMMPGGDRRAWEALEPVLTKIAATSDSGPCVTHCGAGSAGHFVKMVHNGIEYGDMQLIAEAYDLLRHVVGLTAGDAAEVFAEWNEGPLRSFLVEITAKILAFKERGDRTALVERIVDAAEQKGTGRWTSQIALELAVPVPTMTSAVDARVLSAARDLRARAAKLYPEAPKAIPRAKRKAAIGRIENALYAAKIQSYAQGFHLLRAASDEHGYGTDLAEIARIWKAGCIIRAAFLDRIREAYRKDALLPSLLLDSTFRADIRKRMGDWRETVILGVRSGIALPAMSAALSYFDSVRRKRLPANLIQAQRDFFGAHTYERLDREGTFHTEWPS